MAMTHELRLPSPSAAYAPPAGYLAQIVRARAYVVEPSLHLERLTGRVAQPLPLPTVVQPQLKAPADEPAREPKVVSEPPLGFSEALRVARCRLEDCHITPGVGDLLWMQPAVTWLANMICAFGKLDEEVARAPRAN